MPIGLAAGITLGSMAYGAYKDYQDNKQIRKQKESRRTYFDNEIKPLLGTDNLPEELTEQEVEALRASQLELPLAQINNEFLNLTRSNDANTGKAGFSTNTFAIDDFNQRASLLGKRRSEVEFNVEQGLDGIQEQVREMSRSAKLRAKELELQYKY